MGILELSEFIIGRAKSLGISKAEIARRAKISRTELYSILKGDIRQTRLTTFIGLAEALQVHPLTLITHFCNEFKALSSSWQQINPANGNDDPV
ncbi:MAG: helix-turn-helix transcriptional regulator [Firmicutes bacterium]|nr:helix-turn-helix transcriptional regulator [Bacillota bacterium]